MNLLFFLIIIKIIIEHPIFYLLLFTQVFGIYFLNKYIINKYEIKKENIISNFYKTQNNTNEKNIKIYNKNIENIELFLYFWKHLVWVLYLILVFIFLFSLVLF